MRFLMSFCTIIALAVLLAVYAAKDITSNKDTEEEKEDIALEDYKPISKRHLDNYFNKFPENKKMCDIHKESIRDKKDGYRVNTIGNISNISSEIKYDYTHDGEFLDVRLVCEYDIRILYNVYIYTHMKEEFQRHDGGVFRLKKYYDPETKRLSSLEFIE